MEQADKMIAAILTVSVNGVGGLTDAKTAVSRYREVLDELKKPI